MAIQNNINAMLGTVAGAAAMGKHVSEQAKANELAENNAAINAAEKIDETVADAQELGANYDEYKEKQDSLIKDAEKYGKQFDDLTLNGSPESRLMTELYGEDAGKEMLTKQKDEAFEKEQQAKDDIAMLQKSMDELAKKRDAKRLQAKIYRDQINKVGQKGKDLGIVKLPWEEEKR